MAKRGLLLLVGVLLAADAGGATVVPRLARFPAVVVPRRTSPEPAPPAVSAANRPRLSARHQLEIEHLVDTAIAHGEMPGAVVIIGRRDGVIFRRAFGLAEVEPERHALREDALFDLASVTKAVATATSIARLVDTGRMRYDDPVSRWVPAFGVADKRAISVRQLLTHTSGLPADNEIGAESAGIARAIGSIAATPLLAPPGDRYVYSDLGFIVLGEVVARASGQPLDRFASEQLFAPLGMRETLFRPGPTLEPRAAPTERVDDRWLRGVVHDPRARALGGVAGHAGLFSTADDLARFSRMLLGKGTLDAVRVLSPEAVERMTAPIRIGDARVTLGWDSPDDPERAAFSPESFGHEGYTGTSLWIDPERDLFVVFLSSRLHPDGKGRVGPVAQAIRAVAARAVRDLDARPRRIALGIDVLQAEHFRPLVGKRVLLVTHDAARNRDGRRTADVLFAAPNVRLVALAAPEHGLGVDQDGPVSDACDVRTGLPVLSLYGSQSEVGRELGNVDTVVVDLVDVGARFYTYEATLGRVLAAAAKSKRDVLVLDRPNPNAAVRPEGPISDPDRKSLINPFSLPVAHGMTLGELGRLFASELTPQPNLRVIAMQGYSHEDRFEDLGLDWFDPSPNLHSPTEAELYPALALLEATNVSVGRGTATPFELVGAPFVDASRLAQRLAGLALPGVVVHPVSFVPNADPYRGELCHGVRFELTDPSRLRPVTLGLSLAEALRALWPNEWQGENLGLLLANRQATAAILEGRTARDVVDAAAGDAAAFERKRAPFLLYR